MEKITFKEFYEKHQKNLIEIANETGLSISLLSRLKSGDLKLSKTTKDVFTNKYHIELIPVSKDDSYEDKYLKLEEEHQKTSEKLKETLKKQELLENRLHKLENKEKIIKEIQKKDLANFDDKLTKKILNLLFK